MPRPPRPILAALLLALAAPASAATYVMGPLPSEFGGAMMNPDADRFDNIQRARQAITKLRLAVEKCLSRGVTNVSRGKPSGVGTCLSDPAKGVLPRYAAKIALLSAEPGSLPPCADFPGKGPDVAELMRALHEWTYCGDPPPSPSGAFLDGPPWM